MFGKVFFLLVIFSVEAIDLLEIIQDYPELEKCYPTWPMLDASGKIPTGILTGNLMDLGNFDECLDIENSTTKGQYCMVKLHLPSKYIVEGLPLTKKLHNINIPMKSPQNVEERIMVQGADPTDLSKGLVLGWCLPHECNISVLTGVLSNYLEVIDKDLKLTPLLGGMCQTKKDLEYEYDASSIVFITFAAATLLLMIISTIYDIYLNQYKKKPAHILFLAFSVKTNGQKLFSVSNSADQLGCLNGIRFISMMWVLYGHRFSAIAMEPLMNLKALGTWMEKPINMYILNAPVSVDSFLLLSGCLVGYIYCLSKEKGVRFNIILYYVHRYLRLTPVFAVVIWFHASVIQFFGSGPFWPFGLMVMLKDNCEKNWWAALLYIQNYYNNTSMCVGQSWYLSVDLQLFILSPIILLPLWRWPKTTLMFSGILVLGSIASSFAVTFVKELGAFSVDTTNSEQYMTYYYYATHTRFGPWLMGVMLGYYLFKLKKNKHNRITLHPSQVAFGWIVGMGLLLSTLFAGHDLLLHPTRLGNSFFNGFHRHGWALGLCWVIYACTQGYGGPVNSILSWSLFQILGRFTYTIYLVHLTIMYSMLASSRNPTQFSDFRVMHLFWGDFMFSFVISIFLTLAYESPMITIEKVLFKTGRKRTNGLPVHKPANSQNGESNQAFVED